MVKRYSLLLVVIALFVVTLACRSIIAIGWTELIIIIVLVAVLLGPLMFRIYRFIDKVQKISKEEEKKKRG